MKNGSLVDAVIYAAPWNIKLFLRSPKATPLQGADLKKLDPIPSSSSAPVVSIVIDPDNWRARLRRHRK